MWLELQDRFEKIFTSPLIRVVVIADKNKTNAMKKGEINTYLKEIKLDKDSLPVRNLLFVEMK